MIKAITIIFLISLLPQQKLAAQAPGPGFAVVMTGYFLNVDGGIYFQPADSPGKQIWEALDGRSFALSPRDQNDQCIKSAEDIGDSILITSYDTSEKAYHDTEVRYFYCKLKVMLFLLDSQYTNGFRGPARIISYKGSNYSIGMVSFRNAVLELLPSNRNNLLLMSMYYKKRGYGTPQWLRDQVKNLR